MFAHASYDGVLWATFDDFRFVRVPIPGDINDDGDADLDDLPVLVDVLLGLDTDPYHVCAADLDGSGAPDGNDIQPFVGLLING
jgi:hypothetical protein